MSALYEATVPQFRKMLSNADKWIDKAVDHAKKKSFDPNVFVTSRLAPDQYPLVRQIQSMCDGAKFACARLSAKEAPKHPDTEQTIDELKARIKTVLAYLETFKAEDFANAETRLIDLPFLEGKSLTGTDYINEMVIPNFYFHVVTTYAILRHNGVDLGKMDFIGSLRLKDRG
jgi:hypothetical protein